ADELRPHLAHDGLDLGQLGHGRAVVARGRAEPPSVGGPGAGGPVRGRAGYGAGAPRGGPVACLRSCRRGPRSARPCSCSPPAAAPPPGPPPLSPAPRYPLPTGALSAANAVGDLDGDGLVDLVGPTLNSVRLIRGRADASFKPIESTPVDGADFLGVLGDVD